MGRRSTNAYQVKNTFVEVAMPIPEDPDFSRAARAMSANDVDNQCAQVPQDDHFMANTPSPFLHPAPAPNDDLLEMPLLPGYGLRDNNVSFAFGDIPADCSQGLFGFEDASTGGYNQAMMYDPASGMYMAYDWQGMPYNSGYPMMGDMQCGIPTEYQIGGYNQNAQNGGHNHAEQLLDELSKKLAASTGLQGADNAVLYQGSVIPEAMQMQGYEAYLDPASEIYPAMDFPNSSLMGGVHHEQGQHMVERGSRKSRHRDRGEGRPDHQDVQGSSMVNEAPCVQGPVNFTTVMFRNIPNKYTREMLVKQLEQDLKGQFDFVYLPIDFKNKCNVGYAFINFRTIEACQIFLNDFNNVEVRKCLPGLNSRKVTEVTPARVQGFDENVQRLRNSPVMRELAHHTDWMPLIFDLNGNQQLFPAPERQLEPIKPRRRGREDGHRDQ